MRLTDLHTTDAILAELGKRIALHRLARNWTQAELARHAGIGRATVQRLERGDGVETSSLMKVLRALDALDALDGALPAAVKLPVAELERQRRRERQRASGSHGSGGEDGEDEPWTWGEPS